MPRRASPKPPYAKPTKEDLLAAADGKIPDVLGDNLAVLLVGVNPSLYSAAVGHHFARPGNRFWRALADGGFTPDVLSPWEDQDLPKFGVGLTNICPRATARADELSEAELRRGAARLQRLIRRRQPKWVALLGVTAYRTAFQVPHAKVGQQEHQLAGARLWILPNPSGLNAHYQRDDFARLFGELRRAAALKDLSS